MDFDAIGIRIVRGDERIDITPLPGIFTNIPAKEYELLALWARSVCGRRAEKR